MRIRKIVIFALHLPFVVLIWLCVTSPFFIHSSVLNSSFNFVFDFIEKNFNSGPLATVLLLFIIPILSLISCLFLAIKEKQINKNSIVYIIMSLISAVSVLIFFVIMQIAMSNYVVN